MSQDASAGQSKRSQGPAYVYGPMVYQFPSEREGESEKGKLKSNQAVNFLVPILIIVLVVGGVVIYLREIGIDVRQLSFRRSFGDQRIFRSPNEEQRRPPIITQARVTADSLYLREGPGMMYVATYLLPENWGVSLIGDYQTDDNGEVWARVFVQTDEGPQEGWVSRRYVE
ncbi:MAG TPA: hypothetical protein VFV58_23555 [Blastocatellia bacterium]|nr:hypothetical protein [Blastocatellia bacterium]